MLFTYVRPAEKDPRDHPRHIPATQSLPKGGALRVVPSDCHAVPGARQILIHGFAVMPNHVHILISPGEDQPLPKCVQLIKGGYSFAARTVEPKEIWQNGYHEHRVRDLSDYDNQLRYIANNPPAARFGEDYPFVHTHARWKGFTDPCPPWLLG